MSKSDLKAAMQLLQVNKPLRLAGRAPSFVPPIQTPVENPTQAEISTWVPKPTQAEKATEVALATQVENVTTVEKPTWVENPTQVAIPTSVESATPVIKPTQVGNQTPVSKTTEVEKPTIAHVDQASAMKRATEQDSSVVLEARACEGLEKGYTRLPNSILMKMANGDLTRGEIKMLLLIARFTISFQRKLTPLSKTVLERQSGLRGAAVLEALAGLVAKNLIIKEQGDQHRPNQLGLVLPADWDQLTTPVQKPTQVGNSTPVTKTTSGEVEKATPAPVGNPSPFNPRKILKCNFMEMIEEL